ncbi:MAG: DUF2191 domain-containing protein [Acidimicrobiia bacterium]
MNIADGVSEAAKRLALQEGTTLTALIEEGLRRVLDERGRSAPFKLRKETFEGSGLSPEFGDASWERIRDEIYPA